MMYIRINTIVAVVHVLCLINHVNAWDSEQLEVFDVVEEVKQNFYELFNVSKDASGSEIRSAFRILSLKFHPDKNPDVDTSEQFRNVVSVYDVLKSPTKRKYYDEVVINGLPNWRSAVYYYRYVRKIGLAEVCVILFVIVTIGQYLVNWAAYLEKKYTLQELSKKKKTNRKSKPEDEPDIEIPKPSFYNTLPVQIPKLVWYSIVSLPSAIGLLKTAVAQQIEEATKPPPPEPEPEPPKIKTIRKRNKFVLPEGPNFEVQSVGVNSGSNDNKAPAPTGGGLWTDDDLAELIRLVKKFPQGSSKRWENIAEALSRSVPEVTYMSNKMKENGYKLPSEQEEEETPQIKVKQKTKKDLESGDEVKKWSQIQQRALEEALAKYPKGCSDRWDRIADCVPEKTKDECMMRFRYLADLVKKQRSDKTENEENAL